MSKRIAVLEADGNTPGEYVKKSVAELMVRRLLWKWEQVNRVARKLPVREFIPDGTRFVLPQRPYVPEKMPPVEVGGCHFVPPVADPNSTVPHFVKVHRLGV